MLRVVDACTALEKEHLVEIVGKLSIHAANKAATASYSIRGVGSIVQAATTQ